MQPATIHKPLLRHLRLSALKNLWVLVLFLISATGYCGNANQPITGTGNQAEGDIVDGEQLRIDLFDGVEDGKVDLGDSVLNAYAEKVYFKLVDSIQRVIEKPEYDVTTKNELREYLYTQLHKVNRANIYAIKRFDNIFRFMLGELNARQQNKLCAYLNGNIQQAFYGFSLIKNEGCADSFLIFAAQTRPDLVFLNFNRYHDKDYALHVIEETSKIAPVTVKRYFNPGDAIYKTLKSYCK